MQGLIGSYISSAQLTDQHPSGQQYIFILSTVSTSGTQGDIPHSVLGTGTARIHRGGSQAHPPEAGAGLQVLSSQQEVINNSPGCGEDKLLPTQTLWSSTVQTSSQTTKCKSLHLKLSHLPCNTIFLQCTLIFCL